MEWNPLKQRTGIAVHRRGRDVPHLDAAMAALKFADQVHGATREKFRGVMAIPLLVVLDRREVVAAEVVDQAIRFFGGVQGVGGDCGVLKQATVLPEEFLGDRFSRSAAKWGAVVGHEVEGVREAAQVLAGQRAPASPSLVPF